jgi:hypothetical protein
MGCSGRGQEAYNLRNLTGIRQAEEEEDYPVSRYENSTSLRKTITLNLGEKGVSDEGE